MTSKELTGVALKCLAVYLLFSAILVIPMGIMSIDRFASYQDVDRFGWSVLAALVMCVVMVVCVILVWRVAKSLVRTCETTPTDELHCDISPSSLEAMLFRVLGVYFIVSNMKPFIVKLASFQSWKALGYDLRAPVIEEIALLATIVFGMWLLAKPQAWVELLKKLRRVGLQPKVGQVSSESAPSASSDEPST